MDGFVGRFADWLKKPYHDDMSVIGWIAFIGLIGVIAAGWNQAITRMVD